MKIKVFYNIDRPESSDIPVDSEKVRTVESIPTSGEPDKSPKKERQRLNDKLVTYRKKVEALPDGEDKEKFQKALKIAEDFVKKNSSLGEKQLTRMLESKQPQSDGWKEFRKAISLLHNKFDNKESKDLTEEEKINKLEENYGLKIEKTDMGMYVLHVDKTEYTLSSFDLVEKKIKELGLEKRKNLEISREDTEKLKSMSNDEFLRYSPEERLKYITKEHANAKGLKENDKLTFTFTFDGVYNQDLWRKTTAGQTLPSQVNVVKEGETEYKRRGLKGEFFSQGGKRLIINEGTHISIGKELSKEELDKIQNKNDMIYKAYMGELKKEEVSQEQQKDFFDKNGNLLEKYKLTDKEKERFEKNMDIVREAIARNIDPKFATLIFSAAVKEKSYIDISRKTLVEDMFTEFDRQVPKIVMWNGDLLENRKYPDELVVRLLSKFGGEDWKKIAKEYGIKDNDIDSAVKRAVYAENPNVNLEGIDNEKIKKMLDYALSLTHKGKAGIIGAKHCTDWVSRVWERTLGIDNADAGAIIYNSMRSLGGGRFTGIDAPDYIKSSVKPGDYVVIEFSPGHTHGVIALGPVSNGKFPTVSYPNSPNHPFPREHTYTNPKIIRVKRAIA